MRRASALHHKGGGFLGKRILVAGAGHGGLAAAALLARAGLDVTVYEKEREGTLGYDWTDIFAPTAWKAVRMPMPPKDLFEYKHNMTFLSPDQKTMFTQQIPKDELEIKMERRDIYRLLIEQAEKFGVTIEYDCVVEGPLMLGSRVAGLRTSGGDVYGDLVIDAAGVDSPVRTNLPKHCGIEKSPGAFEKFYVYRAFFDCPPGAEQDVKFKVYLFPNNQPGIAWVAAEEGYTDMLIGRFAPFDEEEAKDTADFLRGSNPTLGRTVLRGGQFTTIPVRHPLGMMVFDGYAAIGDSAFMTVPIIGSGIANSLKAARMLADTILADRDGAYDFEHLWKYQTRYYKNIGAGLAAVNCIKTLMTKLTPDELNFMLEKEILTAEDFAIGSDRNDLASMFSMSPADVKYRLRELIRDRTLTAKVLGLGIHIGKVVAATETLPQKPNRYLAKKWATQYTSLF